MTGDDRKAALLDVRGLTVSFHGPTGVTRASRSTDLSIDRGEVVGIVGESGSGKSMTLRALCDLVPAPGRVGFERFAFDGQSYADPRELQALRGSRVAMIFQDPGNALNPVMTVGAQLVETLRAQAMPRAASRARAVELLERVGIPNAPARLRSYAHELSGGMRQRVMIALALSCAPDLLLADEPTTACDVTTQEQILDLLRELQADTGMAILLVTHDLGVVAQLCDRVHVMYAGYFVERGPTEAIIHRPLHPYTRGLVAATPQLYADALPAGIPGSPPDLAQLADGCPFAARCSDSQPSCLTLDMAVEARSACACPITRLDPASMTPTAVPTPVEP